VLPDREASDANFRLLLLAAQTIKRTQMAELPLAYFSLWTVKLGGWLPLIDSCTQCGSPLPGNAPIFFARSLGVFVCGRCRRPGMRVLPAAAVGVARRMLAERLDHLSSDSIPLRSARDLADVMLDIIEDQIGRKLTSREMLESQA
jgi:DNA repair protein RecO